jgi:hypothetical protein
MSSLYRLAPAAAWLALGAVAPLAHALDNAGALPNPANAEASVPATIYQPALTFRPVTPNTSTPAQNWKALNQQVGAYDSMALTMGNASGPQAEAVSPKTGATPAATPAQSPGPDPHAHHKKKGAQ